MKLLKALKAIQMLSTPALMEMVGIRGKIRDRKFGFPVYATYNYKGGYESGTNTGQVYVPGGFSVMDIKFDFAKISADRTAAGQTAITSTDVMQVAGVKAGQWLLATAIQVTTAEGAALTCDVGDGDDPDGYLNDADLNAVGWTTSQITTAFSMATTAGKLYTADDTLDVVINTSGANVAVFHLFAVNIDLRSYRD